MDVYNLAVTSLLVILIFAVYHNNQDIGKINSSAKSANQVLEKSEVNDAYFFKSNNQIMNYLKARDGMKKELDKLKLEVKNNSKKKHRSGPSARAIRHDRQRTKSNNGSDQENLQVRCELPSKHVADRDTKTSSKRR